MMRIFFQAVFVIFLGFTGWLVMANTLSFKQTDCTYNSEDRYIWIELSNGVSRKGLSFVSDGVVFDSDVFGMSTAADYNNVMRVVFSEGEQGYGQLIVEMKYEDNFLKIKDVGLVKIQCWVHMKSLVAANPLSHHIEMIDVKRNKVSFKESVH